MARRRRLITSDEAVTAEKQHTKCCPDCPWSRNALPGWLGGSTPEEWLRAAHADGRIDCHVIANQQCAGAATYRRNVGKLPRDKSLLVLPPDRAKVFATPAEFAAYHACKGPPVNVT